MQLWKKKVFFVYMTALNTSYLLMNLIRCVAAVSQIDQLLLLVMWSCMMCVSSCTNVSTAGCDDGNTCVSVMWSDWSSVSGLVMWHNSSYYNHHQTLCSLWSFITVKISINIFNISDIRIYLTKMCGNFQWSRNTLILLNSIYILVSFLIIGVAVHGETNDVINKRC